MNDAPDRPLLRIDRVEIDNLNPLRSLRLPDDGLGWKGRIPDLVLVGGANGTGKTTLLKFLANAVGGWPAERTEQWPKQSVANITFSAASGSPGETPWGILAGLLEKSIRYIFPWTNLKYIGGKTEAGGLHRDPHQLGEWFASEHQSRVIYFPSERRLARVNPKINDAIFPAENGDFFIQWAESSRWSKSTEATLFHARWKDLNALANGHPNPGNFKEYSEEFSLFTGGKKELTWTDDGELVIQTREGERHGLSSLSSGEKQILIFLTDLKRLWRPGSLVLIDEPELHLHEAWQTYLLERFKALLQERGGQLWLATQSDHLFRIADPGTKLVLR